MIPFNYIALLSGKHVKTSISKIAKDIVHHFGQSFLTNMKDLG